LLIELSNNCTSFAAEIIPFTKLLMRRHKIVLLVILFGITVKSFAQSEPSSLDKALAFPSKLSSTLYDQQQHIEGKLDRQTDKYIHKLLRQEKKLQHRLQKKDSALVAQLQLGSDSLYQSWKQTFSSDSNQLNNLPTYYSGKVDSMTMAIQFLEKQPLLNKLPTAQYQQLKDQYNVIGRQLNQTERLKQLVQQRKDLLREKLANIGGVKKYLEKYSHQAYYYQQQLQEYKQALESPAMLEKKALEVLSQVPAFRKYFDKFSVLGSMFRLPGQVEDMDPATLLNGLQTRSSVLAELNNRLGGSDNAQQAVRGGLQQGQEQLSSIKDKLTNALNKGEPVDMPGFKPNQQKSKSFLKRLEPGTNLQSSKANGIFPITSDIGLSLGYKLNDKSVIGVGASYKIGWGESVRRISITHQGMGFRSFIDVKIKKSFWLTGGGEWNYRDRFQHLAILKTVNTWQQSVLFGLQKKQKVGKYKATASMLYDALWDRQVPKGQPVMFRMGYSFK
jgi:ribosome-associated translation inhibitor RaiA